MPSSGYRSAWHPAEHSGSWLPGAPAPEPEQVSSAWRSDLDSLSFQPQGHTGHCMVHRRAFQTLLGLRPAPEECAAYYLLNHAAFQTAATDKISRAALPKDANFHLTSRDVLRACKAC
jgi:hypothetical protein